MNILGTDVTMIRGDTEAMKVSLSDELGTKINLVTGDKVYLTIKQNAGTDEKVFQKVVTVFDDGEALIPINPEDTKGVKPQTYVYDIQVNRGTGDVKTVIPKSNFTILEDVTHE